jgi:hypothetical protein
LSTLSALSTLSTLSTLSQKSASKIALSAAAAMFVAATAGVAIAADAADDAGHRNYYQQRAAVGQRRFLYKQTETRHFLIQPAGSVVAHDLQFAELRVL